MRNKRRVSNTKNFLVSGGAIVCAVVLGVVLLSSTNAEPVPHRNMVDTKVRQYSDRHITQNAVNTDLEFKRIAFNTDIPRPSFFANQMAAAVRTFKAIANSSENVGGEAKEYGTWIWTPVMDMTPEYVEVVLSEAKAGGVNTIYVSIDSYLDIFVMDKGEERERQKEAFGDKLEDFIIRANKKGIEVDAEAGWRNWAEGYNAYKAFAIVNYVKDFNATRKHKFRGFQYDVEPYLLDEYQVDPASVLKNFIKLVDQTERSLGENGLRFAVVIPDFYDGKDKMTPKFSYKGKKDYTFRHLLNILDRRPDSSIIVMSYRSFATGFDGSIEVSDNELQTAKGGAYQTKVIIAQETGNVPPPYITFHNTSKSYLFKQVGRIHEAFGSNPNFGGIAIHYANAFLALE